GLLYSLLTGCSAAWLAYLHGVQVVGGSNPLIPTRRYRGFRSLRKPLYFCFFKIYVLLMSGVLQSLRQLKERKKENEMARIPNFIHNTDIGQNFLIDH